MKSNKSFSKNIINEIFSIIEEKVKVQNNVFIKELSSISGYSAGHFQRVFYSCAGMNVGTYIRRRRLSRAALLLKLTDVNIYEISINAGFSSQQSFSRAFSRQFHCPPKMFRASNTWSFVYYQPRIHPNNFQRFVFDFIRGDFSELIGDNTYFLLPSISGDRLTVNYKRTMGDQYNRVRNYLEVSRCDMSICESEFISLVYEELLPALKIILTENVIFKIKDACGEDNIVGRYYIPIL